MNETNKFLSMSMMRTEMEACEDTASERYCQRNKKKGGCDSKKMAKVCKKTCNLCQDECLDTLGSLHCLSEG